MGIESTGSDLEAAVRAMVERARNVDAVTFREGEELDGLLKKLTFSSGKDAFGKPFKKLEPSTEERRRQGSNNPLEDTGVLKRSVFAEGKPGAKIVFGISGAAALYGYTHLFGRGAIGFRRRKGGTGVFPPVPRRAFLPVDGQGKISLERSQFQKWYERFQRRISRWIFEGVEE